MLRRGWQLELRMTRSHRGRIALIHGNDGTDVRVGKICRSLSRMGYDTHFIGWDRRPNAKKEIDLGGAQSHILRLETAFGKGTPATMLCFAAHTWRTLAHLRPETVCCVNEEYCLLAVPLKHLYYRHLICDIFDALSDRLSVRSWPYRAAAGIVSALSHGAADCLIATDDVRRGRFGRHQGKCAVIRNYPEDPGEAFWRKNVEGPVKVYVSGSLFLQKGLKQILAAVEAMEDVQIVAAGPFYDRFAKEEFANHPKVVYNGIVTARRSLELAAECDAIFAFYAPTKSLEFTSPNKIYDALCVGRPAIINREVDVAPWIMENGLGMQCAYEDVEALREIIASLRDRRGGLSEYSERLRAVFAKGYSWERMEERLAYVYRNPKTAARELDKVLGARPAATAGRQA